MISKLILLKVDAVSKLKGKQEIGGSTTFNTAKTSNRLIKNEVAVDG